MRDLWRQTLKLWRRDPALWLPALVADVCAHLVDIAANPLASRFSLPSDYALIYILIYI
jgi:hypothetical protein